MGLLLPALVALAMQLAQMLPLPVAVRLALPGYAFIAWNGLFTSPAQLGPLLIGVAVSLVWAVVATALAYLLFVRRDFTNLAYDGSGAARSPSGLLPLAGLLAVTVGWSPWRPRRRAPGSSRTRCSVARHRVRPPLPPADRAAAPPDVTEAQLRTTAACTKGGGQVAQEGPGNDWRCVVSWHLPGVAATGTAIYQLDITADGRYVADGDGPKEVNGYFLVRTPTGDAPNPLWQFDGNVELLPTHEGIVPMQVTRRVGVEKQQVPLRQTRRPPGTLVTAGTTAVALVVTGTGGRLASYQFGTDQVGQTTAKGQVVSSDQYINPIGDRLVINNGKIMSSTVSPDGTHLAASVTDGGMALAIVDLKTGRCSSSSATTRRRPAHQRQRRRPGRPDVLARRRSCGWARPTATRFTVNPTAPSPTRRSSRSRRTGPSTRWWARRCSRRRLHRVLRGQRPEPGGRHRRGDRGHQAELGRGQRPARPWSWSAQALRQQRGRAPGEGPATPRSTPTTPRCRPTPRPAPPPPARSASSTWRTRPPPSEHRRRPAPDRPVRQERRAVRHQHRHQHVSVIDTRKDKVVQTIATQPWPEASVGYEPDAVTLTDDGHLLVTLGRANAVAVYRYTPAGAGQLRRPAPDGLLPRGDHHRRQARRGLQHPRHRRPPPPTPPGTAPTTRRRACSGSRCRATSPSGTRPRSSSRTAGPRLGQTGQGPEPREAGAGPARLGDPSTIKHVFLLVKENRTYDQVFGDIPQGNGDPALAQFGENVTPNQHALAEQFGLYDNTYDIGTNSAEGHNWLMQADNPEYTESSAGEYLRSYDTEDDALGHQKSGFIWTGAQAAGKTVQGLRRVPVSWRPSRPARAGRTCTATPRTWPRPGSRHRLPDGRVLADPVAQRRVGARLPEVRHRRPGHLPVRRSGSRTSRRTARRT
jgi:hypothetical protein